MEKELDTIVQSVLRHLDSKIKSLGKEDYRDVLEELTTDLEARLECVNDEIAEEGGE